MPGKKRRPANEGVKNAKGEEPNKKRKLEPPFKWHIAPKNNTTPDAPSYISAPRDQLILLQRDEIQDFMNNPKSWAWDMLLEWAMSCWFCNECIAYPTDRRVAVTSTDWWTWIRCIDSKPAKTKPVAKAAEGIPESTAQMDDPDKDRPLRMAVKVAGDIDIFSRDFVALPINVNNNHWILAVLVNIGQVVRDEKAEPPVLLRPMVLIANSLSVVDTTSVEKALKLWISHCAATLAPGRKTHKFPTHNLECPTQKNTYDCGFYMVHSLYCIWRHLDVLIKTVPKRLDHKLYAEIWRSDRAERSREFWQDALKVSLDLEKIREEI